MDYNYYLFKDKNGDIYTNYKSYYNRKQKNENDKVLNKTFFKTMFLCAVLTIIPLICYGIFNTKLLLWISYTFFGLTILSAILSVVYLFRAEDKSYIRDFKLTKEYIDQVEQYKLEKNKKYVENLFRLIKRYNELEKQKQLKEQEEQIKEEPKQPQEVIVKLDKTSTEEIIEGVNKVVTKNIIKTLKICLDSQEKKVVKIEEKTEGKKDVKTEKENNQQEQKKENDKLNETPKRKKKENKERGK